MKNQRKRWVAYVRSSGSDRAGATPERFFSILECYTPWVETGKGSEAYLELGGVQRLWEHPQSIIDSFQAELSRLGMRAACGLGSNKFLARAAASLAGEGESIRVMPQGERDFLEGLSVEFWPGLSERMISQLRMLGIRRVGDLARVEPFWVKRIWGGSGLVMRQQACGFDPRPVIRKPPLALASFPPPRSCLFPFPGKREKLDLLMRLAVFFRRRYGGKAARINASGANKR